MWTTAARHIVAAARQTRGEDVDTAVWAYQSTYLAHPADPEADLARVAGGERRQRQEVEPAAEGGPAVAVLRGAERAEDGEQGGGALQCGAVRRQ